MPAALVLRVMIGDETDDYIWHHENSALAGPLSAALGCKVWCFTRERRSGYSSSWCHGPSGSCNRFEQESDAPLRTGASRIGAPWSILEDLLAGMRTGPQQRLSDPDDPALLEAAVAALWQDERSKYPGRDEIPIRLPRQVVEELQQVAARLSSDISTLFWAAWEWAKPDSFSRLLSESGKKRRPSKLAPPPGIKPGPPEDPPPPLKGSDDWVMLSLWVPPRLARELDRLSEHCERGTGTVFLRAYALSRDRVLGSTVGTPMVAARKPTVHAKGGAVTVMVPAEGTALDDEELFKPSSIWARRIDRRRGGWFAERPPKARSGPAFKRMCDVIMSRPGHWTHGQTITDQRSAEISLTGLAREVLERFAEGAPAGEPAAVEVEAAGACMIQPHHARKVVASSAVEFWVGSGGLTFAVECLMAAMGLNVVVSGWGPDGRWYLLRHDAPYDGSRGVLLNGVGLGAARSLRRYLAAADDADHDAARQRCAELRGSHGLATLVAAAYLFPGEQQWVQEATDAKARLHDGNLDYLPWLFASLTRSPLVPDNGIDYFEHLPAMVEGFGKELVPNIEKQLRYMIGFKPSGHATKLKLLGQALSAIPTDEAMSLLLSLFSVRGFAEQIEAAVKNYPRRAARLRQ